MNTSQATILNTAAALFAGIVIVVMLFQWMAAPAYKTGNETVLSMAADDNLKVLPIELEALIGQGKLNDYTLVDLRPAHDFNRGSLPGAINIPFETLLDKSSLKQIRKSGKPALLFSGDESQSAAATVLLISKGYDNVQMAANDYQYIRGHVLDGFQPASAFTHSEKARFDYNRFFRSGGGTESTPARTQPKIIQTEMVTTKGGC